MDLNTVELEEEVKDSEEEVVEGWYEPVVDPGVLEILEWGD